MAVTVFLPGIMGSGLELNGDRVWPPTLGQAIGGYDQVNELLNPACTPTEVIENISCHRVYKPLLEVLRDTMPGEALVEFPYDWRQDLFDTVEVLADRLDDVDDGGPIRIVAHSMGGLISRLLLEGGDFTNRPWFERIELLVTLATPHVGAPLALVRILGLEGSAGISAEDTALIANDNRYPSAYQLLPPSGEQAVWDMRSAQAPLVDIYADGGALGLDAGLLQRAEALHAALDLSRRPEHVRYFSFVASGHDTVTRVNIRSSSSGTDRTEGDDAGDGTVPVWSAAAGAVQRQVVQGEHSKFFRDEVVHFRIADLLGRPPSFSPATMGQRTNTIRLSANKSVVDVAEGLIEVLVIPTQPTNEISGELIVSELTDADESIVDSIPIDYRGPLVNRVSVRLPIPLHAGAYRLSFDGTPPIDVNGQDALAVQGAVP